MSEYQIQVSQNFDGGWQWRARSQDGLDNHQHVRLYNSREEAAESAREWVARDTFVSEWETIDCD